MNFWKLLPNPLLLKLLICCLFAAMKAHGQQNLVPNPSFELIDSCPAGHNLGGDPWVVQNWNVPPGSITTPDLFSTCYNGTIPVYPHYDVSVPNNFAGICYPKTGDNYMGFLLKYGSKTGGENLQVQLTSPLVSNQTYLCGFNIQRADSSQYQVDKVGMHISNIAEHQSVNQAMSYLVPQIENHTGIMYDSLNWLTVEGIFTATGGEQYITIGNFYTNENTLIDSIDIEVSGTQGWTFCCRGYYYLDDVYIIPYDENLIVEKPDTICWGEEITLMAHGSAKYDWYVNDTWYSSDSVITLELTDKLVIQTVGYLDTVEFELGVKNCRIDCEEILHASNIFTPNGDGINDFLEFNAFPIHSLEVFNRWGNKLFSGGYNAKWNGDQVPEGVYFYKVSYDCDNEAQISTGFIQLIR
jgi:gliding motility-associated-like protein